MSKTIIITGASSAMGRAIAKELMREGDTLVLHYNNNRAALGEFKNRKGVTLLQADFSTPEGISTFREKLPEADVLVHCASMVNTGLLVSMELDDCRRMITCNLLSIISLCQAIIPSMTAKREGCIVLISSVAASKGNRGQSVYAGTKGFLEAYMRSVAAEYGAKGIRVNCVAPGPMEEGSVSELLGYAKETVLQSTALKQLGRVQDVASVVGFLCSDKAQFVTGRVFSVDGGFQQGV